MKGKSFLIGIFVLAITLIPTMYVAAQWNLGGWSATTLTAAVTSGDSTIFEAEDYTSKSSSGYIGTSGSNYSGSGYFNEESGSWFQWNNINISGNVTLRFRYAAAATGRTSTISVNGSNVGTLFNGNTGSWDSYSTEDVTVSLNSGSNTIRVTRSGGNARIDRVVVIGGGSTTTTTAASTSTTTTTSGGGSTVFECENYTSKSSSGYIGNSGSNYSGSGYFNEESGSWFQWNNINISGNVTLRFRYAAAESGRSSTISVNGSNVGTLFNGNTGGWDTYSTEEVTASLNSGSNTIRVTRSGGNARIDRMEVIGGGSTTTTTTTTSTTTTTAASTSTTTTSGGGEEHVWLEAECGNVGSLWNTSSDGSASGGTYVTIQSGNNSTSSAPSSSSGHITYNFSVSSSGNYIIWGRVIAPNGNDDSFWIRMDGGSWVRWNNIASGSSWHWDEVHNADNSNQVVNYNLSSGSHTLTVAYREDGTELDKIYITNSGDTPSGTGGEATNCGGTTTSTTTTTSGGSTSTTTTSGGGQCTIPPMPSYSSLVDNPRFPDPFEFMDGSRMTSKNDWTCRRAEISALAQEFEFGTKPGKPSSVTGSYSNNRITVTCSNGGSSISFSCSISYPSSGRAPYPAIIGIGASSLNNSLLSSLGVAVINFPNDEIANQSGASSRGRGKFYNLYGSNHSAGALIAWAWGVSRLIDALETTPAANIDASRIGVTGCSRNGKGALACGAFDERVVLTIPQESGSGGAASWRVSDYQKSQGQNVQTLSQIVGENCWFRENFSQFRNTATKLPFDHHMIEGLCAPRALLVIENTSMEWLGNLSTYTTARVAHMIWEALGAPDKMGFSQVGHSDHCGFPSSQNSDLQAYVEKFLVGSGSANTNIMKTDGGFSFDQARWVDWAIPTLQQKYTEKTIRIYASEVHKDEVSIIKGNSGIDIRLSVATSKNVKAEIYNILGQRIEKLMDEVKPAGQYTLHWDGSNGIYFVKIKIGDKVYSKKTVILR